MSEFRPEHGADHLSEYDLERESLIEYLNEPVEFDPPCLPGEHMPQEVEVAVIVKSLVCERCGMVVKKAVLTT